MEDDDEQVDSIGVHRFLPPAASGGAAPGFALAFRGHGDAAYPVGAVLIGG